MFGLLKKKNSDREITTNPDILFETDVDTSQIKVHGLKLQDGADLIPVDNIDTTTFEKLPPEALRFSDARAKLTWKDNKVYYESPEGLKEHVLAERIKSVLDLGGILHMKSGAKYVIRDKSIIGIGIHQGVLAPFKKIKKDNIESKFGKASEINKEYEQVDGTLFHTEYIYKARDMKILFDDWDKEIILINLGLFPYGIDNRKP